MDSLKQYESNSEDSSNDESGETESDKHTSVSSDHDFFVMLEDDNAIKPDNTPVKADNLNTKTEFRMNDVTVDIPQSSFWEGVSTSDVRVEESSTNLKRKVGIKGNASNKYPKSHSDAVKLTAHVSDQVKTQSSQNDKARKMYFVHSKVQHLLHKNVSNNRPPTKLEWTNPGHASATNRIQWNIPSFSHLLVSCSMDSSIKVWNVWSTMEPCVRTIRVHDRAVKDVTWSPDGRQLLSSSYDRTAALTDVEKGTTVQQFRHPGFVTCGRFHPVTGSLCVTGTSSCIMIWDCRAPATPVRSLTYKDKFGQVQDIAFIPDGTKLFSCSDLVSKDSADRNLMAWDFQSGVTLSNQIYQERYTLSQLRVHCSSNQLLAQSQGGYIALFSLTNPYKMNKHKRFEGHKVEGYSVGFDISPDGSLVYSGSSDGRLCCYDYQTGRLYCAIGTGLSVVMDTACHPVLTSTVAVCAWDGTIQVRK